MCTTAEKKQGGRQEEHRDIVWGVCHAHRTKQHSAVLSL